MLMFSSEFIWCDLSTFDLSKACAFYGAVFNWTEHNKTGSTGGDDYTLFYSGSQSSAGIYRMPEFFQSIGMPSFWMSYVRVESLTQSVALAIKLGAKCEIEPTSFDDNSQFALIRDPSGAGFTLYEGPDLSGRDHDARHGRMMWNELHVPSLGIAEQFYSELFGWDIVPDQSLSYRRIVHSPSGDPIASILELDEKSKGPKNYWAVIFATHNLNSTLKAVANNGGSVIVQPGAGIEFAMVADNQGAMFCFAESNAVETG